jgi:iron complex outermembrane receptor protein
MRSISLGARKRVIPLTCAILACVCSPTRLFAQAVQNQTESLMEIVVTAQKREQLLEDVPISVSAVGADAIMGNRIQNVVDLNAVVPNLAVRATAGGSQIPAFSMRGVTSYGVVPGSDKEISIYIDGVYLGSATGSTFDFPDIERIEVLRGPQGTLFGRNSTAGAISIITPDPTGVFGVHQELTGGNYDQFRSKTAVNLPAFGPVSVKVTYVHDQRRGDIENLGAGQVWDRPEPGINEDRFQTSPRYLGNQDVDAFFVAAKFQPTDDLKFTYKLDYSQNHFTPEGNAVIGIYPPGLGPAGILLSTIVATQATPYQFDSSAQRPDAVNNSWQTEGFQRNWGQSLTAAYRVNDQISVKNILGYRQSFINSNDQIDGIGGLKVTEASLPIFAAFAGLPPAAASAPAFQALVGAPFEVVAIATQSSSKQVSDEAQFFYDSKYLTATAGAIYFKLDTVAGSPRGLPNNEVLTPLPGGIVAPGEATSYNYEASRAVYGQLEGHITSQIDLIGGYRLTHDDKSGTLYSIKPFSFNFNDTKSTYSVGVDYKPIQGILTYLKYSTAYVPGGAVGPISYGNETASSWEAGFKTDLTKRLTTDLAIFQVSYHNLQTAQGGVTVGQPDIGTLTIDQGGMQARGAEFEVHAVPFSGLTLGAGVGYTSEYFTSVNPIIGTLSTFTPTLQPRWTANISAEYDTAPVFGRAYLVFRTDTNWRSQERTDPYPIPTPVYNVIKYSPETTLINARFALAGIDLPQGRAQIALWGRNLTNNRSIVFPDLFGQFLAASTFQAARTYGIDLIYDY